MTEAGSGKIPQPDTVRPGMTAVAALIASVTAVYLISQFLRNSVGVIAPDLERELGLSAEALGLLSSAFFMTFAAAQIPLGVIIDRYGPRAAMLGSVALAALGCVVFAEAENTALLILGRALMGLGCSSFFVAPLTIYARWFSPSRFSTLTSMQLGLGSLGTLFATAPLAASAEAIGWRASFLSVAGITVLAGLIVALIVRDDPPGAAPRSGPPQSLSATISGLLEVWRTPGVFRLFAMQLACYSTFATMIGLWAGPYLSDIYGYDLAARGDTLLAMAIGQIIGALAWGPTDRLFGGSKIPVTVGALATMATLIGFAAVGAMPTWALIPSFAFFGFICAYTPVLTAHGRLLFPQHLVGRGITFLNMATIGGVFLQQAATGFLVGAVSGTADPRPIAAYQAVFLFIAACIALALLAYCKAPDSDLGRR